jgi:hypothetical protein
VLTAFTFALHSCGNLQAAVKNLRMNTIVCAQRQLPGINCGVDFKLDDDERVVGNKDLQFFVLGRADADPWTTDLVGANTTVDDWCPPPGPPAPVGRGAKAAAKQSTAEAVAAPVHVLLLGYPRISNEGQTTMWSWAEAMHG